MVSRHSIIITLVLALILSLLPIPDWMLWLKPAWVLMVLIYWAMTTPQVNVGTAWVMGLLVDLFNGTLLGEHALAFTIVIYFVVRMQSRLRLYPFLQQGLSIFIFVMLYQFILYCIQGFIGGLPRSGLYWISPLISVLVWPWLYILLRNNRRWIKARF